MPINMTTIDTPNVCPHCGVEKSRIQFSLSTLQTMVLSLTHRAEKAEVEVERLKKLCEMALESADDAVEERDIKRRIADDICSLRKDLNK